MTQTVLITGGAGFLGINLTRYLLARGYKVVSLDIADFTYPERDQITEIMEGRKPGPPRDWAKPDGNKPTPPSTGSVEGTPAPQA